MSKALERQGAVLPDRLPDSTVALPEPADVAPDVIVDRRRATTLRRLVRNPSGLFGLSLLTVVVGAVCLAPLIARFNPNAINVDALNLLPSGTHPFGTDFLGRDLLARTLYGGRASLAVGLAVVAIESVLGTVLGLLAGYGGGAIDSVIVRSMEVLLSVPGILLALGIIAVVGPGLDSVVVALAIAGIPGYVRLARGMTLRVREMDYVQSARAVGCNPLRILGCHILPNAVDPLIVMATTSFGAAILAASALSYLGVGAQPPDADWGSLLRSGYDHMFLAWSEIVLPGVAVSLAVLGATLLGDGLTDARDPRAS
jgi:peptide/nickel transport system permease protein